MKKSSIALSIILIFIWVAFFQKSFSYIVVYMLEGLLAILSMLYLNSKHQTVFSLHEWPEYIISLIFSVSVLLADYRLADGLPYMDGEGRISEGLIAGIEFCVSVSVLLIGGFLVFLYIIEWVKHYYIKISLKRDTIQRFHPAFVYLASFLIICLIYNMIFFLCYYPGAISSDGFDQLKEVVSGNIGNASPHYHTLLISFWFNIGMNLFGNINAAVATYIVFQTVFISACFAFMTVTLYQMQIDWRIVLCVSIVQLLIPYNIAFSFWVLKEAMFAGSTFLLIIAVFRYLSGIGNRKLLNIGLIVIGAMGMCLFRHNGFYSFALVTIFFLLMFRKKHIVVFGLFVCVILTSYYMTHQALRNQGGGVQQTYPYASLSIPCQQIAKVITECEDLNEEQLELLSHVIEVESVSEYYQPFSYDSLVALIKKTGKMDDGYYNDHKMDYVRLYLELGFKHPIKYIEAWADQTFGYWNAGNSSLAWAYGPQQNDMGIFLDNKSELAKALMDAYLRYYFVVELLKLVVSTGLYTWTTIILLYISCLKKNKSLAFTTIIVLSIVFVILLSAPVASESRYVYPMFMSMPFLVMGSLWSENIEENKQSLDNHSGI